MAGGRFPDRRSFSAHIPAKLQTVIKKCLKVNADDRYQSAIDVGNALADIDGSTLDWRLVKNDDTKTWTKNEDGTEIRFSVHEDGSCECRKAVA